MTEEGKQEAMEASEDVQVVNVRGVYETMESFMATAGVEKVYGRPIRRDEVTLIPTAEVVTALGFGSGGGSGTDSQSQGGGSGGGGGGRTFSRPVAVVIASGDGVRVEPVVDVTKIALAALTAFGFMMTTKKRMQRGAIE